MVRWAIYAVVGAAGAVFIGQYLVIALLGCGLFELAWTVGIGHATVCRLPVVRH